MDSTPTIDEMKSLVFGLGRGVGIKIIPRHYNGDYGTQIRHLARDVVNASKFPLDDISTSILDQANNLTLLLDTDVDGHLIADALERYIHSRVQWVCRDAVE